MSWDAVAHVIANSQHKGGDLLVLILIANHAGSDDWSCWPSTALLARESRLTQRQVQRIIRSLEGSGELRTVIGGGRNGANRYHVSAQSPLTPVSGRHNVTPDAGVAEGRHGRHPNHKEPSVEPSLLQPEADRLCTLLADLVEQNGSKRPAISATWRAEAERMLRIDKRPPEEAAMLIRWCQADPFWKSNILSMPKFRSKYDQLRLRSKSSNGHRPDPPRALTDGEVYQQLEEARRERHR